MNAWERFTVPVYCSPHMDADTVWLSKDVEINRGAPTAIFALNEFAIERLIAAIDKLDFELKSFDDLLMLKDMVIVAFKFKR